MICSIDSGAKQSEEGLRNRFVAFDSFLQWWKSFNWFVYLKKEKMY
jgi:hypothetical protein